MALQLTKKFLQSKGNHEQNKKTTYQIGEKDATHLQSIQISPAVLYQKIKQPNQKMYGQHK